MKRHTNLRRVKEDRQARIDRRRRTRPSRVEKLSYDDMARELVKAGLCPAVILGPQRPQRPITDAGDAA